MFLPHTGRPANRPPQQNRANLVAGQALDLDLPIPPGAHDLRQPRRVVAVGLVEPYLFASARSGSVKHASQRFAERSTSNI